MTAHAVVLQPVRFRVAQGAEVLLPRFGSTPIEKRWRRQLERILLMAGSWGDWSESHILDQVFGATAWTAPVTLYFGLWGTAGSITDAFTGATAGEITGGSYARVAVTNNTTNFPAATGTAPTVKKNGVAITFAAASANWNGGAAINQVGVLDGNAGTVADHGIAWADLTVAKTILSGDQGSFAINDFQVTQD